MKVYTFQLRAQIGENPSFDKITVPVCGCPTSIPTAELNCLTPETAKYCGELLKETCLRDYMNKQGLTNLVININVELER